MTATLIACSHGTRSHEGRAAISALVEHVRELLPGIRVAEAFVDVQVPAVDSVVARYAPEGPVVVVPLLLSTGYHTNVDIAEAVAAFPGVACATPALGPHELLADVLVELLARHDLGPADAVVLAAAGSSDPAAARDVAGMADLLAERLDRPVEIGFATSGRPIAEAVASARSGGAARVVIASYVLAPGYFANVIAAGGGDVVTEPLAPDERVAAIVAERFTRAM